MAATAEPTRLADEMQTLGRAAVAAADVLRHATAEQKNAALLAAATALRANGAEILLANGCRYERGAQRRARTGAPRPAGTQ